MKFSNHFIVDVWPKRCYLTEDLLQRILESPISIELQSDGRTKVWGYSSEFNKFVRVVLDIDGETIITAFFDRNYKTQERTDNEIQL